MRLRSILGLHEDDNASGWTCMPDDILRALAERVDLGTQVAMSRVNRNTRMAVGGADLRARAESEWTEAMHELFGSALPAAFRLLGTQVSTGRAGIAWKVTGHLINLVTAAVNVALSVAEALEPWRVSEFDQEIDAVMGVLPSPRWTELREAYVRAYKVAPAVRSLALEKGRLGVTLSTETHARIRDAVKSWAYGHAGVMMHSFPSWFSGRAPNSDHDDLIANVFAAGARSDSAMIQAMLLAGGPFEGVQGWFRRSH